MRLGSIASAIFGVTALLVTGASGAFALPLGHAQDGADGVLAPTYPEIEADVDFTAIVALNNCSGSLVRFTSSEPSDHAMVLTNGHCLEGGFVDAGDAVVDRASSRTFRLLNADSSTLATLRASRVIYATMTGTDMTLYKLTATYADIESEHGVQALTIADQRASVGDPMRVVSGYWRRIYACNIGAFVHTLKEDEWTFRDSIRYSQPGCETIGGTSGSPILHAVTKEVIGVNNTGNEDGGRCTMNNPCEVDADGNVTFTRGASYGQEVYWIYACINESNELDLDRAGCELTKPIP